MRFDLILRVAVKMLLPGMLLFALYVQFHGDYGPGGGFQAGTIAGAAVILHALVWGTSAAQRIVPQGLVEALIPLGVLIYAGVGVAGFFTGSAFLDYSHLAHDPVHGQEWGVFLVEAGVFLTVSATMVAIFYAFVGRGRTYVTAIADVMTHYNQWITIALMVGGLYIVIARGNMVKKLIGLSIFQSSVYLLYISAGKILGGTAPIIADGVSVYSHPLPHVLILTAIVVGVATLALGLALVVRINEAYGTIEEDEVFGADRGAEAAARRDRAEPAGPAG